MFDVLVVACVLIMCVVFYHVLPTTVNFMWRDHWAFSHAQANFSIGTCMAALLIERPRGGAAVPAPPCSPCNRQPAWSTVKPWSTVVVNQVNAIYNKTCSRATVQQPVPINDAKEGGLGRKRGGFRSKTSKTHRQGENSKTHRQRKSRSNVSECEEQYMT